MAIRTINCQECGAPRVTRQPNTKYCVVCALVRDVRYVEQRTMRKTCIVCGVTFAPLKREEQLCSKCYPLPRTAVTARCVLCGKERPVLCDEVHACATCARSLSKRVEFLRKLLKKQEFLRKQTHPNGEELDRAREEAEAEERRRQEADVIPI